MSLLNDFKQFVMRGNVVELAVAVVIGIAFGLIVASFVDHILMPPIGMLIGGINFSEFVIVLREATADEEAVTINYGLFIQSLVSFIIIAFAVFMVVKGVEKTQKKKEVAPEEPTAEEKLLAEIRDLLKGKG